MIITVGREVIIILPPGSLERAVRGGIGTPMRADSGSWFNSSTLHSLCVPSRMGKNNIGRRAEAYRAERFFQLGMKGNDPMGKQTYQDEFRVVLTPRRIGDCGYVRVSDRFMEPDEAKRRKLYEEAANEIAAQARRHVDGCTVEVESSRVEVCEWCGSTWTEGNSPHNGGCCWRDTEVFEQCEAANEP